jgi:hypothetical protein
MPVHIEAPPSLIGEIAPVTLTGAAANSLFGTLAAGGGRGTAHRAPAEKVAAEIAS